jgi:CRP/FNR family transcriptional regulator
MVLAGDSKSIPNPVIDDNAIVFAPTLKRRRTPPVHLRAPSCAACSSHGPGWFCSLGAAVLADLELATGTIDIQPHSVLFSQGEHASNLYIVCGGFLKVTIRTADREAIIRIAGPGSLLGLHAALSGQACEISAIALTGARLRLIARESFLTLLRTHLEAQRMAIKCLCDEYSYVLDDLSRIALAETVGARLSNLLLKLSRQIGEPLPEGGFSFHLLLSHAEIAAMIDTTRETVSRLLCQFRKKGWISIDRSQVIVRDFERLKVFTQEQNQPSGQPERGDCLIRLVTPAGLQLRTTR